MLFGEQIPTYASFLGNMAESRKTRGHRIGTLLTWGHTACFPKWFYQFTAVCLLKLSSSSQSAVMPRNGFVCIPFITYDIEHFVTSHGHMDILFFWSKYVILSPFSLYYLPSSDWFVSILYIFFYVNTLSEVLQLFFYNTVAYILLNGFNEQKFWIWMYSCLLFSFMQWLVLYISFIRHFSHLKFIKTVFYFFQNCNRFTFYF